MYHTYIVESCLFISSPCQRPSEFLISFDVCHLSVEGNKHRANKRLYGVCICSSGKWLLMFN